MRVGSFRRLGWYRFCQILLVWLFLSVMGTIARAQDAPIRKEISLDPGWRFIRQDVPGAEAPGFDDSAWQSVSLPHTWNAQDGADGGNNYYRGIAWYRLHTKPDATLAGKSLYLKFDGSATVTDVFVNGQSVGEHRGNFAAFCFDVTRLLKPGGDNVIAVKVDNGRKDDVAPLSGDFTIYGGLYRDVHLLALSPLSITPLDYASPGIYLKQSDVSNRAANIEITARLRNSGTDAKPVTLRFAVRDASDKIVATASATATIPANGDNTDIVQKITLRRPHLWNGVADPYLYSVTADVLDGTTVVDRVVQPLGVRSFRVDPDKGLFLNGKHYDLHGVNRHQDRQDKGWAISVQDHQEDFSLIREMGSTGIRLSHYQHAPPFYDLCDQGGLVVWAELPLVNKLNATDDFRNNARQQLTELIKQNYNHPSILFWSLFNELNFPTRDPKEWDLIVQLNQQAHELDPTRLTTAASNRPVEHPVNFITDIIAFNRYEGWYGGKPTDWAKTLDAMHQKYPQRCIAISEYGAGASINQHEALPLLQPRTTGRWHPEEWQSVVHEDAWQAMEERPWLWGTFLWCMYDFGSDGRREGDMFGRNDKGMVTYDRKTRKDSFYWYKANWTKDPFVYITSRRFTPHPLEPTTIKAYSNCDAVTLTVNGKVVSQKRGTNHIFLWDAIPLTAGENRIEVAAEQKGKTYSDQCVWTASADVQPHLTPQPPPATK